MNDAQHAIRTVSLGTVFRLLRWPFILLSMTVIPRIMGHVTYGQYALFTSVYLIADMLTDVSITQIFGRFVPGDNSSEHFEKQRQLLRSVLIIGTALTVALAAILSFVVWRHPFESFPAVWLLPLCVLLFLTRIEGVLFAFVYGLNHIARYSSREVLRSMFTFIVVVALYSRFGLIGAIWAMVLREMVLTVIVLPWVKDYLAGGRTAPIREMKTLVLFGLQFYVPTLLFGILQRSGNVFVQSITHSSEEVAHFDIANQFFLMSLTFLGVILMTLLPSMTKLHMDNEHQTIHRWHGRAMTYCGAMIALVFNAIVWLGKPAVQMCLGPDFTPSYSIILVIVIAMVPGLVCYIGINYAILEKKSAAYISGVICGIAGMALICWVLIPRIGAIGAAWATGAGHLILALFFFVRYKKHLLPIIVEFMKPLLIGGCFAIGLAFDVRLRYAILLFAMSTALYVAILSALHIINWALLIGIVKSVFAPAKNGPAAS
ncbi:MAG: lipopolysaccharide biosynthesis protein [Deltaproteobacteria bacterium]|nr:lipopolysaccharide biosynthesis protein [Deltaproteobacteria bacterium]